MRLPVVTFMFMINHMIFHNIVFGQRPNFEVVIGTNYLDSIEKDKSTHSLKNTEKFSDSSQTAEDNIKSVLDVLNQRDTTIIRNNACTKDGMKHLNIIMRLIHTRILKKKYSMDFEKDRLSDTLLSIYLNIDTDNGRHFRMRFIVLASTGQIDRIFLIESPDKVSEIALKSNRIKISKKVGDHVQEDKSVEEELEQLLYIEPVEFQIMKEFIQAHYVHDLTKKNPMIACIAKYIS